MPDRFTQDPLDDYLDEAGRRLSQGARDVQEGWHSILSGDFDPILDAYRIATQSGALRGPGIPRRADGGAIGDAYRTARDYLKDAWTPKETLQPALNIPEGASPWEEAKIAGQWALQQAPDPLRQGAVENAAQFLGAIGRRPPGIGHNMPPEEYKLSRDEMTALRGVKQSTDLPSVRDMEIQRAIATARREPHLIPAGNQSEGYYIGSPPDITSKRALTNRRKEFDAYVAADPRGADWYDRARLGLSEATGGDPAQNYWATRQHGMFSAGVDPISEAGYVIKELNANIAGTPVKAARPAQHEAHMAAVAAGDPDLYMLGKKTGMYAQKLLPEQTQLGATGVNDFRYKNQWGYPGRESPTEAQHRFMDYETALAVDRANRTMLGGRSDWTGEKLQAAPWVRQKALKLLADRPAMTEKYTLAGYSPEEAQRLAYEDAFQLAQITPADAYKRMAAFATHEAVPGADTGHLPGSIKASPEERALYSADPLSTWATAPGGRDVIYSGLGTPNGPKMRVLPTTEMTGNYTPEGGPTEFNPGWVARPVTATQTSTTGPYRLAPADRALLEAGESVRAYIDAQNAGAAHRNFPQGRARDLMSYFIPMERGATQGEIQRMATAGSKVGLGDVVDTGRGMTVTSFYPPLEGGYSTKQRRAIEDALRIAKPEGSRDLNRVFTDAIYQNYVDKWKKGVGSGAATEKLLQDVSKTPEIYRAFNENSGIAQMALNRLQRDEAWSKKWGATREDIQNARRIIGGNASPGWLDRLQDAVKKGALLPAVVAPFLSPEILQSARKSEEPES